MAKKYNSFELQNSPIGELVRKAESDFIGGTTHLSKYVDMSLYEDISTIYAYLESKHISGLTDSQGREKPFFNIVLAARNIWFRSTDIDRSNIKIKSTKSSDDIGTFLGTIHLQDFMRRTNFGTFLNTWGLNSASFNESIQKFVEKDGQLIPSVVPWNRIVCDQIDFENNPKIELLELTEAQLYQNPSYDPELVEKLCDALTARETTAGERKDNKSNYIKLYEVHGNFPLSYLTGKEKDEDKYAQQMHVISFVESKDEGKFDDFTLFSGKESKDPYLLTALLPETDGSVTLKGAVKNLFDVQWMQNHSIKAIKDQLDLASKLIFQTSDATFAGQNALSAIETGDILVHKENQPITNIANTSHDITALQNFSAQWKQLGNEISGISEAMLGLNPPSGQAWRQTESLLNESHSLFELMTENKGLAIEKMLREFVIPFLKKKMDNSDEIAATLASHDITKIDAKYIKNYAIKESNKVVKEKLLRGIPVSQDEQQQITQGFADKAKSALDEQGGQRFFAPSEIPDKTWKELFKDLEWEVEVDITNENVDKDAATTLNTLLRFFQAKGGNPLTPEEKFVVEKILRLTGTVSTVELSSMPQSPPPQPAPEKISKSINFKDLPPDGQQQLADQAGIKINSAQVEAGQTKNLNQ